MIQGCPPKKPDTNVVTLEEGLYSLRLLARMEDIEQKVSDLIPPLLRDYVNVTRLQVRRGGSGSTGCGGRRMRSGG